MKQGAGTDVLVSVVPPEGHRVASDVICVVDTSGSMARSADLPDGTERTGLNTLDIVRHALKTVLNTLSLEDRIAVVPFSSSASIAVPLTHADAAGKASATAALDALHPGGGTYMWEGIKQALDLATEAKSDRPTTVLLLTDGEPSDKNHAAQLREYQESTTGNCALPVLSTFGFGYSLDSALLEELAIIGRGQYSFIPDIGLVGTVFVHACANVLCRLAPSCELTLEAPGAVLSCPYLPEKHGGAAASPDRLRLDLGLLQYGQSRDLVVRIEGGTAVSASVLAPGLWPARASLLERVEPSEEQQQEVELQRLRCETVHAIAAARLCDKATALDVCARLRALGEDADPLLQDLEGQVAEAISRPDYFSRWGKHYLPSLERAHALQQCNNFKDPGVQQYGGDVFAECRDAADAIFLQLPAPVPTAPIAARRTAPGCFQTRAASPVDMSRYLDRCGGCFASGDVQLADGRRTPIWAVALGDVVHGGGVVRCVVEMRFPAGVLCPTVDLGGVVVTPWHPVRCADAGGAWAFPAALGETKPRNVEAVYSLLLDGGAAFTIGAWDAVGLGHGLTDDVAAHPFFGSREKVEQNLRAMRGFALGRVVLRADCMLRDPTGKGLVRGFLVDAELPSAEEEMETELACRSCSGGAMLMDAGLQMPAVCA